MSQRSDLPAHPVDRIVAQLNDIETDVDRIFGQIEASFEKPLPVTDVFHQLNALQKSLDSIYAETQRSNLHLLSLPATEQSTIITPPVIEAAQSSLDAAKKERQALSDLITAATNIFAEYPTA